MSTIIDKNTAQKWYLATLLFKYISMDRKLKNGFKRKLFFMEQSYSVTT